MPLSPDHLIALLRARGIRVEVEELLRLHEALQHGTDWSPQRLENVIVGILATCPEDPPRIREAIRELRTGLEPALAPGASVKSGARARRVVGPPPLLSRRLVVSLGLGGVAAAAATVALLSRRRGPINPDPDPEIEGQTAPTSATSGEHDEHSEHGESGEHGEHSESGEDPGPDPPELPPPKPTEPERTEEPWITAEREKQAAYRAAQAARREQEARARVQAIAEIDAARTTRRVLVPRFVAKQTSWRRVIGAALLGPAMVTGVLGWFAHRAWRRRSRETQRFGGPGLEVAPGPSLFWLAPRERRWPPLLAVEAREALVWGVGQAVSEERTRLLDLDASIDATIEYGGLPELRFRHKRRLQRVWLWHDQSAAGPIGARLCAEVHQTLHGYGLAVEVGRFWGLPERLERDDGRLLSLDALDEEREFSTVLVLTDGNELLRQWEWRDQSGHSRQSQVRALLGRLSGWPHLTIVHTGTRERLRALRVLLEPFGIPCVPLEAFPLAVRERDHLARTLGTLASTENVWMWAALCALYPLPVPEALALALLRHLDLPLSPLSLGQLMEQSVTTAGIQFKPQTRARLIERLRRTLDDGSGGLPRPMQQALAFWRAETIADDADWASDTSGRGLHRRLVVALLDLWTDPERAAKELSALWKSPQMPAIREELGRMRPAGKRPGAPDPGSFHVPLDPTTLSPKARAQLQAAGMGGLGTPEVAGAQRWPWWLRGLVLLAVLIFVTSAALLAVDSLRPQKLAVEDIGQWALARPGDLALEPPAKAEAGNQLLAHIAGEWREIGDWPIAEDVDLVTETLEVKCTGNSGLRRCLGEDAPEVVPARRIAVLDAERDSVDAVRFADSLLDRGLVDAAWIGEWPPWLADRTVGAIEGRRGLEVWVFSIDPDFAPTRAPDDKMPPYPSIVGGSTGRALAADFCGDTTVCAVTESGGLVWSLRGDVAGTTSTQFAPQSARITAAALSPDGLRIVLAYEDKTARVWMADGTGEPVVLTGHADRVLAAGWSADGKRIVTASADKTARVWNADGTGEPVVLGGHDASVVFAAFSPDGARVVTTSEDNTARSWNADGTGEPDEHGAQAVVFKGHEDRINAAAWSPDGARVVTVSSDRTARVWRADGMGEPIVFAGHQAAVLSAAWSPDGQHILSGSEDNIARLWDSATGAEQAMLRHGVGPGVGDVDFSSDGQMLTASWAGTVRVWTADGRPVSARAERSRASLEGLRDWDEAPWARTQIHRSTDWRHLLGSFSAGEDVAPPVTDRSAVAFAEVSKDPAALLVMDAYGPVTAAAGIGDASINERKPDDSLLVGNQNGEVIRWVLTGGAETAASAHKGAVAGFASTMGFTVSVGDDGTGRVWDHGSDKMVVIDPLIQRSAAALDRKGLVVATQSGEVLALDGRGEPVPVSKPTWGTVVDGLVSRSADQMAVLSGGAIHVCEKTEEWACRAHEVEFAPQLLAASPVDGVFAVASKAQVPTIGIMLGLGSAAGNNGPTPLTARFKGPIGWPVALRFSPDGARLAVASLDGTVWLASASGEGCPRILRHETPLADIAFSPDGSLLATGSYDGDVRVFRAVDGAGPVRLAGHRGPVHSVSFLPDDAEQRILSVSDDGSVRIWAAPKAEALAELKVTEQLCVAEPKPDPEPEPVPPPTPARTSEVPGDPVLPASRAINDSATFVPLQDPDGDGLIGDKDHCPNRAGTALNGCPDRTVDLDADGVLNGDDKCPEVEENQNGYQDEDGCPDEIPVKLAKFTGTIKGIYFDLDKDTIKPKSRPVIDRAVEVLDQFSTMRIEVSGHTDSTGSPAYTKDLTRRRAESVKRYMVERGISADRIETRGAGSDEPVDTNKTAAGRAKNRRIEFTILNGEDPSPTATKKPDPIVAPAKIAPRHTGRIEGLYFNPYSDTIQPLSRPDLDLQVTALRRSKLSRVEISCHSDSEGTADGNRSLTLRRAQAVKAYFVEQGISPSLIEVRGAGSDSPIDTNATAAGRANNRRCEIRGLPLPANLASLTGVIRGIYFDLNKDTIKSTSNTALDRVVAALKSDTVKIEISGHSDSIGSPDYNRDLTRRRAESVKKYLVDHGIAPERLEVRGAGPDEPLDTNKTAAGRAKNRRIEFTILAL